MAPPTWNPQLPEPSQDPRIGQDPQYQTDLAQERFNFLNDYHDILQQLGYTDDQGNVIPGLVDIEANKQRGAYQYAQDLAERGVTEAAQRSGTLFSGRRGDQLAEAIHPYVTARATLEENLPRQLSSLLNRAQGRISQYGLGISGAAARAIGRYVPPGAGGSGGGGGGGGGGGDTTPPPIDTTNYTGGTTPYSPILPHGAVPEVDLPAQPPVTTAPAPKSTYDPKVANMLKGIGGFAYDEYIKRNPPPAKLAGGGVVDEPTDALIGEAGPEAVVPLGGGIRDAIARLLIMENQRQQQQWRDVVLPPQPGLGQQLAPGRQVDQQQAPPPRVPSVKAVGLKAAARILNEAAKEHEHEAQQGTPMRPPQRSPAPVQHPGPRMIYANTGPRNPIRSFTHQIG